MCRRIIVSTHRQTYIQQTNKQATTLTHTQTDKHKHIQTNKNTQTNKQKHKKQAHTPTRSAHRRVSTATSRGECGSGNGAHRFEGGFGGDFSHSGVEGVCRDLTRELFDDLSIGAQAQLDLAQETGLVRHVEEHGMFAPHSVETLVECLRLCDGLRALSVARRYVQSSHCCTLEEDHTERERESVCVFGVRE
jgi:hypothetical protein